MVQAITSTTILPDDSDRALLIGRVWANSENGPCPVLLKDGVLYDLTSLAPTTSELLEKTDLVAALADTSKFAALGTLDSFLDKSAGELLAPNDLQAVKAAGVTFADSMLERVIEEQAKGDPLRAQEIRAKLAPVLGDSLKGLEAGSEKAAEVKKLLQEMGLWSQYLEVGIGPDAEIFSKAQCMSPLAAARSLAFIQSRSGTTLSQKSCSR
jgi:fumarylacetoacetate (FAA) hydrolase family protein